MSDLESEVPELSSLVEELHDVKVKWFSIGLQLKIRPATLKTIESSHPNSNMDRMFSDMMDEWLRIADKPTWDVIVVVLRSRSVGEEALANSLARRRPTPGTEAKERKRQEAIGSVLGGQSELVPYKNYELRMHPLHSANDMSPEVACVIKSLSEKFNELRIQTYIYIENLGVNANQFKVIIFNPIYMWEDADRAQILLADSVAQIFAVISHRKYLNWQNYEVLGEIIKAYGNPELKEDMKSYSDIVNRFEARTPLKEILGLIMTPMRSNCVLVKAPVGDQNNVSAIRRIQNGYARKNGISHLSIPAHSVVKTSPLAILFIVPLELVPRLLLQQASVAKIALNTKQTQQLEDRVIHTLSEEEVLQLLDLPVPPAQRDGMSPCDSLPSMNDFENEVQVFSDEILHTGSTTIICKAKFNRLPCAAKYVHQELTNSGSWYGDRFLKGCDFLRSCHHPNIVMFLCLHHNPAPVLLTELMDESLHQFLERSQVAVPIHTQINICSDVADGLEYIHAKGYIYGDLNATNILLKGARAKIGGFMALHHKTTPSVERSFPPGSPPCMPMRSFSHSDYDESIDCFSYGVLAIHIATRKTPSPISADHASEISASDTERFKATTEKVDPSHPIRPIILRCLEESRPSAAKLSTELSAMKEFPEYVSSQNMPSKIDQMLKRISDQQMENIRLAATETRLRQQIERKTAAANRLKHDKAALTKEYEKMKVSLEQKADSLQSLKQENEALKVEYETEKARLRKENDHVQSKAELCLLSLNFAYQKTHQDCEAAKSKAQELTEEGKETKAQLANTVKEKMDLGEQSKAQIQTIEKKIATAERRRMDLEEENATTREENASLKKRNKELKDRCIETDGYYAQLVKKTQP